MTYFIKLWQHYIGFGKICQYHHYEKKPYYVWLLGDVIKFYCEQSVCYDFAIHCAALIAAIAPSATAVAAWRTCFTQISPAAYTP